MMETICIHQVWKRAGNPQAPVDCSTSRSFVLNLKILKVDAWLKYVFVTTLWLLFGILLDCLKYTELNDIHCVLGGYKMPIIANMSICSIICTYYLPHSITGIHLLHSPPPDCPAVSSPCAWPLPHQIHVYMNHW